MNVHTSCFSTWLKTAVTPFSCPVCKSDYHGMFMKQFFTEEEILSHGELEEDDENVEFVEERQVHGVPVLFDEEDNMYFHTVEHMDIYAQSYKLSEKAQRHNLVYLAKQKRHQYSNSKSNSKSKSKQVQSRFRNMRM